MNNYISSPRIIITGSVVLCLLFSTPIAFLFYFMITFKNEGIQFAQSELAGTARLEQIMALSQQKRLSSNELEVVNQELLSIANTSKLILDPDLDSYYLMTILVQSLPKILTKLHQLNEARSYPEKSSLLLSQINEERIEISKAIFIVRTEDVNFYQEQAPLLHIELEKFDEKLNAYLISYSRHDLKPQDFDTALLYSQWSNCKQYLELMLKSRIHQISSERNNAICMTLGIWLLSIFLSATFTAQLIKKQKELDLELRERTSSLVATSKLSALGEMAGGIAHEINTPLATISLRAEQIELSLLDNDNNKNQIIKEASQSIRTTVSKISKIISGLKTFSRSGENDPMLRTSILAIIEDSLALCSERLKNHGIEVKVEIKSGTPESLLLECRATEICQVIVNLIGNSFDAIRNFSNPWIKIEVQDLGDQIQVCIIDAGTGIPPHIQEKMMLPFYTTKDVGKGTGLGLSISKGIIMKHHGSIFVDNANKNTSIGFKLAKTQSQV